MTEQSEVTAHGGMKSAQPQEVESPATASPYEPVAATLEAQEDMRGAQSLVAEEATAEQDHVDSYLSAQIPQNSAASQFEPSDTMDETSEYLNSLLRSITHERKHFHLLKQERESGKLDIRSVQAILHQSMTHMRIEQLEKEVKELRNLVQGKGENWNHVAEEAKFPVYLHQLRRSTPSEFGLTYEKARLPASKQPAIEVSVQGSSRTGTLQLDGNKASGQAPRRTPERVMIRSHSLLAYLDDVLDAKLMQDVGEMTIGTEETRIFLSLIFLRPFKFFVINEEKIRESAKQLEDRIAAKADPKQSTPIVVVAGKRGCGEPRRTYRDEDLRKDLDILMEVLDSDLEATFELRKNVKDGVDVEVEYEDLWHVFERGDTIISRHNPEHAFRLINYAGGREPLSLGPFHFQEHLNDVKPVDGFALDCYSLSTDGVSYYPILSHFSIRKFSGTRRISGLSYFPLKFCPDADRIAARMARRGRMFVDITSQPFQHMLAKGKTRDEPRQDLDAHVIVDMVLALNAEPTWRPPSGISHDDLTAQDRRETIEKSYCGHSGGVNCCGNPSIHADYAQDEADNTSFLASMSEGLFRPLAADEVAEEHYVLMRPFVHAFVLRSRQWVTLDVSDLGPAVFESSFKDLRIPDDHKTVIQALVKTRKAGTNGGGRTKSRSIGTAMDIVKGKGHGLIILLHGAPGVGKTSTAECVADETRRPLYPITCGDIGETALEVEKNLQHSFHLAQKWGCVLLLDEADVFLTKRTRSNLHQNAVTSVFLRSLEYYSGILFLTTNRVGIMDLAFKSRIQMTLFYPKLDLEVTLQLYEMFIKRAKQEQDQRDMHRFRIKEREILSFAKKHYVQLERDGLETWNGRQIRNAFQTAVALVEYEATVAGPNESKPVLGKKQFKSVAMSAKKFDEYLTSTTGKSESDAARADAWRDDRLASSTAPGSAARNLMAQIQNRAPRDLQKQVAKLDTDAGLESDSEESGSGGEDSEVEEAEEELKATAKGVSIAALGSKSPTMVDEGLSATAAELEQFRRFLEWQGMKKEQGNA